MGMFDVFDVGSNLFNTGYSIYQDQRNFNYSKQLQQQQWQREDTAMQRRFADLAAAGINPLMALGSSGASSSTVSQGSAPLQPLSISSNDMKIKKAEADKAKDDAETSETLNSISIDMARRQNWLDEMNFYNQIGLPYKFGYGLYTDIKHNRSGVKLFVTPDWRNLYDDNSDMYPHITNTNMPLYQQFNDTMSILNSQKGIMSTNYGMALNDLLLSNKDLKWDTLNRVLNSVNQVTGAYQDIFSPFGFNYNKSTIYRK